MKDIGSIFPLYKKDLDTGIDVVSPLVDENRVLYSLCREALYEIAKFHAESGKTVLLPAYTCMTVANPFIEQGWKCCYYSINKQLRIDGEHLMAVASHCQPDIVVAHPFYGMDFNENEVMLLKEMKTMGATIIVDLTQNVFSKQRLPFVDYYVGSLRKWMPMPDGGFLETSGELLEHFYREKDGYTEFVEKQTDSMYLRGVYFENDDQEIKDISRRLNKDAVLSARVKTIPHTMSALSYSIMKKEDVQYNIRRRMANFKYLYDNLKDCDSCQIVCKDIKALTTAPLYFTLYVEDRSELQKKLAAERIYAPVIWPVGCDDMLISDDVCFIYQHILALPCDQRYDEKDMKRIVELINRK